MVEPISSKANDKIKLVRALRQAKARQESGLFLVEGIRHVGELVEAQAAGKTYAALETIYYAPDQLKSEYGQKMVAEQARRGVNCLAVTREVFATLAEKDNPQGILAVARPTPPALSALSSREYPWLVALVAPQDPGNIGTILRTLDAVGASGLLLLDNSADPYHPGAVRASMGTLFWLPVVQATFQEFLLWSSQPIASAAYHLYGTSAHGGCDYRGVQKYAQPCILLMGSEREGLTEAQRQACELLVGLPMRGRATSLNLAVATGALLFEMLKSLE